MITMKTGSKAPVKFVFDDGISETTVVVSPEESSKAIATKLQRVLELEGVILPPAPPAPESQVTLKNIFTPADRAAMDQRMQQAQQGLNGWNGNVNIEDLPEA
jgi:hypothetical protein